MDYRAEALRILEACDPGDCGCKKPHTLPEGCEDLVDQMMELLKETEQEQQEGE